MSWIMPIDRSEKCKGRKLGGGYGSGCSRAPAEGHNGYCKQHDPVERERFRKERNARWDAKWAEQDARRAEAAKQRAIDARKLAAFDGILVALKDVAEIFSDGQAHCLRIKMKTISAAIAACEE